MITSIIIPIEYKDQVNNALNAKYGPDNFSIELKTNGIVTHVGCSWILSEGDRVIVENIVKSIVPNEQIVIDTDISKVFDDVVSENSLTISREENFRFKKI